MGIVSSQYSQTNDLVSLFYLVMDQEIENVWNHSANFGDAVLLGKNQKGDGIPWRRYSEENEGNSGGN